MHIIAIREMTKQMQGSMIRVKREELKESAKRQSQMIQKETNKTPKRMNSPNVKSFVQIEKLKIFISSWIRTYHFKLWGNWSRL